MHAQTTSLHTYTLAQLSHRRDPGAHKPLAKVLRETRVWSARRTCTTLVKTQHRHGPRCKQLRPHLVHTRHVCTQCSRLYSALANVHRCFITRHKRGHKTNWTKTHSTHDLTHASQSVLSLKSQQGVFETISIRSLGFVCLTTSVVKKDLVKELRQGPG